MTCMSVSYFLLFGFSGLVFGFVGMKESLGLVRFDSIDPTPVGVGRERGR